MRKALAEKLLMLDMWLAEHPGKLSYKLASAVYRVRRWLGA